jgi:hypothetical protein
VARVGHALAAAVREGGGEALGVVVAQHVALRAPHHERPADDARQPLGQAWQAGADLLEGLLGEMAAVVLPGPAAVGQFAEVVEQTAAQRALVAGRVEGLGPLHELLERAELGGASTKPAIRCVPFWLTLGATSTRTSAASSEACPPAA